MYYNEDALSTRRGNRLCWIGSEVFVDYKILLADDSATVQKIITLTFSDEGVEVIAVNNGV
jgi:hypothetical protein